MRYDAEHKQKTRERVLKAAAKAIRTDGPHQVGVAGVMAQAGLTHGGFYAHFKSKDELVAAAIGQMFEDGAARIARVSEGETAAQTLIGYIDFYLSPGHRDARSSGCPLPFLAADAPRLAEPARERFARGAEGLERRMAQRIAALDNGHSPDEAGSVLAELVGALSLARAEPDPERSDMILMRSKTALKRRLGLEDAQ
jgi:TetR/AcrR family transcriptional repressor of nem operon